MLAWLLAGCVGIPDGITPVSGFQIERYLGKWYEVARLDHSFERGLSQVSAEYSPRADGDIRVINRGYNDKNNNGKWQKVVPNSSVQPMLGSLKCRSWPFYGGYNIVELDPNYQYVLIAGNSRDYLWILSRTPQLDAAVQQRFGCQSCRIRIRDG